MTTKAQAVATQAQTMAAQANKEVGSHGQPNTITMASHLRDFTQMNSPMFFGSKVNEDYEAFIDEVYEILYVVKLTWNEKSEFDFYKLKDVAQAW